MPVGCERMLTLRNGSSYAQPRGWACTPLDQDEVDGLPEASVRGEWFEPRERRASMTTWGDRPWRSLYAALILLLFCGVVIARAQSSGAGTITGKVTDDTGKPLAYANVSVVGTSWGAFPAEDGSFKIPNIPVGSYSVQVTMMGYEDQKVDAVTVSKAGTATASFR